MLCITDYSGRGQLGTVPLGYRAIKVPCHSGTVPLRYRAIKGYRAIRVLKGTWDIFLNIFLYFLILIFVFSLYFSPFFLIKRTTDHTFSKKSNVFKLHSLLYFFLVCQLYLPTGVNIGPADLAVWGPPTSEGRQRVLWERGRGGGNRYIE